MKKTAKIILLIISLLICIRLALPYIAKTYLNKTLSNLEEYTGHVYDVDISLLRGAYVIDSITISKRESTLDKPLFTSDKIDISLEWKSLFKGAIVGEFVFTKPQINFIKSADTTESQYGDEVNWVEPLEALLPININNLQIVDGTINLYDYDSDKKSKIYLKKLNANFSNMSNVVSHKKILPSEFHVSATSIGKGELSIDGNANFLKQIPDIDYSLTFEKVQVTALNDFIRPNLNIDTEKGSFNLYHELAIKNSQLEGYIKPIISDLKIFKWKDDNDNVVDFLKEAGIDLVTDIFKNHKKNQFAMNIPISGSLEDPKFNNFKALVSTLQNTFIKALKKQTDNSINFSDIKNN